MSSTSDERGRPPAGPGQSAPPEGYLGAEGRITRGPAPELVSAGYDLEIAAAPLLHRGLTLADLAHLVALAEAGVVPGGPAGELAEVLLGLLESDAADFPYGAVWGDAYNSRERHLEQRLGASAGWLHAGRTRREAGRIAFRLALCDHLLRLHAAVARFAVAALDEAAEHAGALWNDTTYLQPAQPSTFGHYVLGFAEEAVRNLARLQRAHDWADASPAGAGGVGGTRVPLDRGRLAELLGFSAVAQHTRDAMWATDGVVEAVTTAAQCATTVDRLAEDLEVYTSPEFGYVTLDASLCRASVQMPQKRNPYALAVIRGGANTLLGRAAGAFATQRTPSARTDNWLYAYGETAGALQLAEHVVVLAAAVLETLAVDVDRLAASAGSHFSCATDVAEVLSLVGGLDYRSAYRLVSAAVAAAIAAGGDELDLEEVLAAVSAQGSGLRSSDDLDALRSAVAAALDPGADVAGRTAVGGSAPQRVGERAADLRKDVEAADAWAQRRLTARRAAEDELVRAARGLLPR